MSLADGVAWEEYSREKYPTDQTKHIDNCICPYCGYKFDGRDACNGDMDCSVITCPKCKKDMQVYLSIEYLCVAIED